MRVVIGSDHAGFALKESIKSFLAAEHIEAVDVGTHSHPHGRSNRSAARRRHRALHRTVRRIADRPETTRNHVTRELVIPSSESPCKPPAGEVKILTRQGWFALRPSGEDVYKLYAESFIGREHLQRIQQEAQALVRKALGS